MMDSETAQKLGRAELELARLEDEYDKLKAALGDPSIAAWVDGHGRAARRLTAFELATVKRLDALGDKIASLEAEIDDLFDDVLFGLAKKEGEGADDPEVLLRAALALLGKLQKAGHTSMEMRVVMRALVDYLKSLATED